jgi:hypothetical protein
MNDFELFKELMVEMSKDNPVKTIRMSSIENLILNGNGKQNSPIRGNQKGPTRRKKLSLLLL